MPRSKTWGSSRYRLPRVLLRRTQLPGPQTAGLVEICVFSVTCGSCPQPSSGDWARSSRRRARYKKPRLGTKIIQPFGSRYEYFYLSVVRIRQLTSVFSSASIMLLLATTTAPPKRSAKRCLSVLATLQPRSTSAGSISRPPTTYQTAKATAWTWRMSTSQQACYLISPAARAGTYRRRGTSSRGRTSCRNSETANASVLILH